MGDCLDVDVSPDTSDPYLLIGAKAGPCTIKMNALETSRGSVALWNRNVNTRNGAGCLAVRWLSPSVFMSGYRTGVMYLFDVRTGGGVRRMAHGTAASSIKRIDSVHVLLHGPNKMAMYDLRYTPVPPYRESVSVPWLEYDRSKALFLGGKCSLDVSPRLGLLATGIKQKGIQLLDLWTGEHIVSNLDGRKTEVGSSSFVSFVRENQVASWDEEEAPSGLLWGSQNMMQEWRID